MRKNLVSQHRSRRAGYALVLSMLSLALFGMAAAVLVRALDWQRGIVRSDAVRLQVDWLAESAVQRAAAKLSDSPEYSGETWLLSESDLGGKATSKAAITTKKAAESERRWDVQIQLEYREGGELVAQLSRTATIDAK